MSKQTKTCNSCRWYAKRQCVNEQSPVYGLFVAAQFGCIDFKPNPSPPEAPPEPSVSTEPTVQELVDRIDTLESRIFHLETNKHFL